ncbi:hypothetical protein RRG08_007431 [Elysia crispata]|uniref:Uncharacterized protein n=1 Tax=Elysia crispata TaxID=231223 RepID=A0AAE1CZA1_9GAST|nr:hypothetical protein RRG08_007431 [Elysia crispata]
MPKLCPFVARRAPASGLVESTNGESCRQSQTDWFLFNLYRALHGSSRLHPELDCQVQRRRLIIYLWSSSRLHPGLDCQVQRRRLIIVSLQALQALLSPRL